MISQNTLDKLEYSKVLSYISKYCVTQSARNFITELTPKEETFEIEKEGTLVSEAKDLLIRNLIVPIEYLPDLTEALAQTKIEGVFLESKKILEILKLLVTSRNIITFLKNNSETAPLLKETTNNLYTDKVLEHHISSIIDDIGEIKDNASPKLKEIRRDLISKRDDLVKTVNRILKRLEAEDVTREDYVTLRDGRIVLPIKVEHKRHIKGFIHSESSTGQTVYIEPAETLELNNDIITLSFEEKREIERLLKELTKRIGHVSHDLKKSLYTIAHIDSIFARAQYSIEISGSFPLLKNDKPFHIIEARHPILIKKYGRHATIPLSLELNKKNVVIITGPNAGGKTVVLKTIGLLTLMVKSGIHIPTHPDSNFHNFNNVLVDIGDQQSIEDDLSTFSSHLSNIKYIIGKGTENSLILIDEIGTGTDPEEGAALASAILIKMQQNKATVFATTHHGSLKIIANELEGFENGAMEFDTTNLKPTYRFQQGIPGSSYAFEIAKRIGFDTDLLISAEKYLDADKHKLEKFIVDVEVKANELQNKLRDAERERSRLEGLTKLYKEKTINIKQEEKEILRKAKQQAEEYIKTINKRIENAIKDIKEQKADKESIKASREVLNEIQDAQKKFLKEEDAVQIEEKFIVGDYVSIKESGSTGKIIDIYNDQKSALVEIGMVKMKVRLENLLHSKKDKVKPVASDTYDKYNFSPSIRLDLRGARAGEVEYEVVRFLDDAYTNGLNKIEILHGKGTGALKKTVHDILKSHEHVNTFYFASVEFGGEGITIVEFK